MALGTILVDFGPKFGDKLGPGYLKNERAKMMSTKIMQKVEFFSYLGPLPEPPGGRTRTPRKRIIGRG